MDQEGTQNPTKALTLLDTPRGVPTIISGTGQGARRRFLEFFTANIRN